MKSIIYAFLGILIAVNIYYCSYPLFHGEINFTTEVARDFLLFREIDSKKIMLIGPRSNANGLFHGPLWSYLNYPVYRLASGNPIVVGWFWILLAILSLGTGFVGTKKLFGTFAAFAFVFIYSSNLITHINGMFHSDATIFFMPLFILSAVLYTKYKKTKYITLHLFSGAMIMQLNIGVGIPLLMLSGVFCLYMIIRYRLWRQVGLFLLVPLLLSNFILFDLRHNFFLSKSAYEFWKFQQTWKPLPIDFLLRNRLETIIDLRVVVDAPSSWLLYFIFGLMLITSILQIKRSKKFRSIYFLIFYFYFGYMLLSFFNKGVILSHFIYFLVPLTAFWFASFLRGNLRFLFFPVLLIAVILNIRSAAKFQYFLDTSFIEKRQESWRGLNLVANAVLGRVKKEPFGYFVFSPDAFAYGPRYAMIYNFQKTNVHAYEYTKKSITYIIAAPPPENDPYMTYAWWRKNPVKITSDPVFTQKFPNGFTIEEYRLSEEEQLVSHDKTIELGIHFR